MFGLNWHNIITLPEWKIPNPTDFHNWFAPLYDHYAQMKDFIMQNFGPSGIYLMILFVLLLLLIIIIYLHSVLNIFRSRSSSQPNQNIVEDDDNYDAEYAEIGDYEYKRQTALIEKDQELSANILKMAEESVAIQENKPFPREIMPLKKRIKIQADQGNQKIREMNHNRSNSSMQTDEDETQLPQGYAALVILILNMLERNVSERKIAQALYAKFSAAYSEEEIICIVQTIRDFIGMCNAGKFNYLPQKAKLPTANDALLALAQGNSTPCLVLLQALLNQQMDKADAENGILQDLNYAIAANYACVMGNIARFTDNELAHNSYELATELSPKNVDAWNRLGDIYVVENSPEKAMIAYQNVLDIGDNALYASAIANAQQNLSLYYERQGWKEKSEQLAGESQKFYDTYGLKNDLSMQESLACDVIWQNSIHNLPMTISALLYA